MPIQHFHDRDARVPSIGEFRKGSEKRADKQGNKRWSGTELEHWRLTLQPEYAHLQADADAFFGDEPKVLAGFMLVGGNSIEGVLTDWMEEYNTAQTLITRCDGQTIIKHLDPTTGQHDFTPIPCHMLNGGSCECQVRAHLKLFFPGFTAQTGITGVFRALTGSSNDLDQWLNALRLAQSMGIGLNTAYWQLARVKREIQTPEMDKTTHQPTGKRMNIPHHLADLTLDPDFAKSHFQRLGFGLQPQLPSGVPEEDEAPEPPPPAPTMQRERGQVRVGGVTTGTPVWWAAITKDSTLLALFEGDTKAQGLMLADTARYLLKKNIYRLDSSPASVAEAIRDSVEFEKLGSQPRVEINEDGDEVIVDDPNVPYGEDGF